jgi:hypothetical protein
LPPATAYSRVSPLPPGARRPHAPNLDVSERIARQALRNGLICRPLGPAMMVEWSIGYSFTGRLGVGGI